MGGSRVWKKLMIKQIHVYELNVPPRPKQINKTKPEKKKKRERDKGGGKYPHHSGSSVWSNV